MIELEEMRKKLKERYIFFAILIIVTACIGIVFFSQKLFYIVVAEVITMFASTHKLKSQHDMRFKKIFVEEELKKIFDNLYYDPKKGLPYNVIASTNMMNMGDRYNSNDYISGEYKGIKFEQSDVHIEKRHKTVDSNGRVNVSYVTLFKGRWLVFDFNKSFKAKVQICQKGFGNSRVQIFFVGKNERFKKVDMESENFNKNFKVYAQNEHDAFYLMTPSLMEKIEKLCGANCGRFLFCFVDQKLHIGIQNGKDSFKPTSVFKELDLNKIEHDISSDIRVITQFVDELNLDNNLFKVEV